MNIAGIEVGADQPCRVIAEISNNHNGSRFLAHRLIEEAKDAGADFVKFQCYTPEELALLRGTPLDEPCPVEPWTDMTMGELYGKAQTPHSWFPSLAEKCKAVGIPWFSSVFGLDSLDVLEAVGCQAYKLASLDRAQAGFRFRVRQTGKPLIQSSPEPMELQGVLQLFCPPGYPQTVKPGEVARAMGDFDGLSFHGTKLTLPKRAIAAGARLVEVHVQLDDEPSELEKDVSLTIKQLKQLCDARGAV